MLKKYEAKSQVNLSVHLPGGATIHVSFHPLTGGGSVLYTRDKALQKGLESHNRFGKLFRLTEVKDDSVQIAPEPVEKKPAEPVVREMEFRNNDDAKDFLAEKFGLSRSKLRTRAAIEQAAAANNVKITWTE